MEFKWLKNKLQLYPDRWIFNFNEVNCFSDGPQCESKEVRSCTTFPNKCNNILSNNVHHACPERASINKNDNTQRSTRIDALEVFSCLTCHYVRVLSLIEASHCSQWESYPPPGAKKHEPRTQEVLEGDPLEPE